MQSCKNWSVKRGTICHYKVYERGTFSLKNGASIKGQGLDLGVEPPRIKLY